MIESCYCCGRTIQTGYWMEITIGKVREYANVCKECYNGNQQ